MGNNDKRLLMVEAHYLPDVNKIEFHLGPMMGDPVQTLMQVAAACVNVAQEKLTEERSNRKGVIERAPPGMRIPRS